MDTVLEIGKIINTHGVRGELKVDPWCDPEDVFPSIEKVQVGGQEHAVAGWRLHKGFVLLTLAGIDTMDAASALKNRVLTVPRDEIGLPDGRYFYSDLFGFDVYDSRTDAVIGILDDVRELPGGDLYVIRGQKGEILIPAVPAFEEGVDFDGHRLLLRTIEGMLPDEN